MIKTWSPASARSSTTARPRPRVAPVTRESLRSVPTGIDDIAAAWRYGTGDAGGHRIRHPSDIRTPCSAGERPAGPGAGRHQLSPRIIVGRSPLSGMVERLAADGKPPPVAPGAHDHPPYRFAELDRLGGDRTLEVDQAPPVVAVRHGQGVVDPQAVRLARFT